LLFIIENMSFLLSTELQAIVGTGNLPESVKQVSYFT